MSNRDERSTSDDLKRRPSKKSVEFGGDVYRTKRRQQPSHAAKHNDNEIYSSSKKSAKNKDKQPHNWKLILFNVAMSVVLACSCLIYVGASALDSQIIKNGDIDGSENAQGLSEIVQSVNENVAYFLVAGVDLSENLTDVIMVVCYDLANNEVNILQIPRDTYVAQGGTGKANSVYGSAQKGESKIKALMRCINDKFGLPIDHYVTFTVQGTVDIIDALGGIDIELERSFNLIDDSVSPEQKKTVGPGMTHLDGQWATALIRHRSSYAQGDIGRVKAQRQIYSAILEKVTSSLSFGQISSLAKNCLDDISTDLTLGQILGYAQKAMKIKMSNVAIYTVPGQSGSYKPMGSYQSYWSIHKQEYVDLVNRYFMPYEADVMTVDDIAITELHTRYDGSYIPFLEGGALSEDEAETTTAN